MTNSATLSVPDRIRCSDADRERTSERLRHAAGDGYVSMEEFEERLAGAYGARYRHELDALVADLPPAARTPMAGWRGVLAVVLAQLGADLALLFGRGGAGWTRRRVLLAAFAALVVVGFVGAVVLGGFEHHGFAPGGGGGPHRGF